MVSIFLVDEVIVLFLVYHALAITIGCHHIHNHSWYLTRHASMLLLVVGIRYFQLIQRIAVSVLTLYYNFAVATMVCFRTEKSQSNRFEDQNLNVGSKSAFG